MNDSILDHLLKAIFSGGPVMIALSILSIILYTSLIRLLLFAVRVRLRDLEARDRYSIEDYQGSNIDDPSQIEWEILLAKYEDVLWNFRQFMQSRLRFANALLIAAPLLGLLGTVIGMLDTFRGLSLQSGYETATMVADGVRRALITTETGLIIAIPALFFIYWIKRVTNKRELELLEVKVLSYGKQIG